MLRVATIPDAVVAAFASPADVQLKPGYALAQALDDRNAQAAILKEAKQLAREQDAARSTGRPTVPAADVLKRLLAAPTAGNSTAGPLFVWEAPASGRRAVSVLSAGRQGVTLKLHNGTGATTEDLIEGVRAALERSKRKARACSGDPSVSPFPRGNIALLCPQPPLSSAEGVLAVLASETRRGRAPSPQ
jgi:ParB family chromosome partitioning protein